MGYARAGFEVIGVDLNPQKRYPFEFHRGDAIAYALAEGWRFDAIHASPPCQAHSQITPNKNKHIDLIPQTRFVLESLGLPYIIENVGGARKTLRNPFMLCGVQFGLKVYRHRFFESNVMIFAPNHEPHRDNTPRAGHGVSEKGFISITSGGKSLEVQHAGKRRAGETGISAKGFVSVVGHFSGIEYCRMAMGIDWMSAKELAQAIPPVYTEWIGRQLLSYAAVEKAVS